MPTSAFAMSAATWRTARSTPSPPNALPPSRRSTASLTPVDAPAGAILRPRAPLSSTTSASTVGRPRESQTRLPMTAAMTSPREPDERRPPLSRVLHARRTPPSVSGRWASIHLAKLRTASFERSSVRYSTGDFPSTRARNSAGRSCAARCSRAAAGSQSTPARYAPPIASNDASSSCATDGTHSVFNSRWLRQKARSKAGSPNHAHSASRNTGPRAPSRIFFGLTSPCTTVSFV